jgi:Pro-kumamolisin, activation domain
MTARRLVALWTIVALGACSSSHGSSLLPQTQAYAPSVASAGASQPGRTLELGGVHDAGRRAAGAAVAATIALRYNHEAELERLVEAISDPHSGSFRHFITAQAFDARYAPTPQQEQRVIAALRAAGFTIVHRYPNRTLIDAAAPSQAAERFFGTHVHDVAQRGYAARYANVSPLIVPAPIAELVRAVELNNLVFAHAASAPATTSDDDDVDLPAAPGTINVIRNGGFRNSLKHWTLCGNAGASTTRQHPQSGKRDALVGSATETSGEIKGWSAICQQVVVPQNGVLTAWLYRSSNEPSKSDGFSRVALVNGQGKLAAILYRGLDNDPNWKKFSWDLAKFAGRTLSVSFAVHGKGQKKFFNSMFVDGVSLIGTRAPSSPSPSPSPSPSTKPSASPTTRPSSSPTTGPSASPTTSPSSAPTPSPSPSPSSKPTTAPTGKPLGPGPGAPLTGPTFGPDAAWAPRAVADGFDFPVQHGYNGTGQTVGFVFPGAVVPSNLANFLQYNHIAHAGAFEQVKVGLGPGSNDGTESTLDVEAIQGLAPGAKVVAYEPADLSNSSILDSYNAALTDPRHPAVLNSPFVECDTIDSNFNTTADADALQGAAIGMTFTAASGDAGSSCYDPAAGGYALGTSAPGSNPHFLAIGGNESIAFGASCPCPVTSSVAWDDAAGGSGGLSGGGVSGYWAIPSYQAGVAGIASSTRRNVPDLALPAVDDDLFFGGTTEVVDGTSWASSIDAALLAEVAQVCGRLGFVNPAVYALFAKEGEGSAFLDVTSGFNGGYVPAVPKGFRAAPGYDDVTGIGMPQGIKFAAALCGRPTSLARRTLER